MYQFLIPKFDNTWQNMEGVILLIPRLYHQIGRSKI